MGKPLTVCGIDVRADSEGRYSLNDLHKAAGGDKRHQPSNWEASQQVKDLVAAIEGETPGIQGIKTLASRYGGTYVARELVYDYAKWISAKFNLQVICAYDALATGDIDGAVANPAPSR